MNPALKSLAAVLFCCVTAAAAQDSGNSKIIDAMRPTGPVTITADHAEFDKNGIMVYSGKVQLVSDTLKLNGDQLELQQFDGGQYLAQIQGTPARLDHAGLVGKNGEAAVPVQAQAAHLNYDTRTGIIEVLGQARMTRGKDEINGDNIRYNALARRIEAAGGAGGQVKIVIQPPAQNTTSGKKP